MATLGASGVLEAGATEAEATAETAAANDERRRARIAGLALIASPILWWVGAVPFLPRLGGFYGTENYGDPVARLNSIAGEQAAWIVQSLLFFAGTVGAVVGLALLTSLLRQTRAATLARAGVVGLVAVMGLSAFSMLVRLTAPMHGVSDLAEVPVFLMAVHSPGWIGLVGTCLTIATVATYAVALFWSGRAKVTGALVAALSGLLLAAVLTAERPPPPVVVYPIAALVGARLLFWGADAAPRSVR